MAQDKNYDSVSTDDTRTETIGSDHTTHYAAEYDGADADTRLDNVISAASDGDKIHLENASYGSTRTITGTYIFIGGGPTTAKLTANWTLDGRSVLQYMRLQSGDLILNSDYTQVQNVYTGGQDITVNASDCSVTMIHGTGSITFDSSTSNGVAGVVTGQVTVTDNGTNTVL